MSAITIGQQGGVHGTRRKGEEQTAPWSRKRTCSREQGARKVSVL